MSLFDSFKNKFNDNNHHFYLIFFILVIFIFMLFKDSGKLLVSDRVNEFNGLYNQSSVHSKQEEAIQNRLLAIKTVVVFYQPTCSGCRKQEHFIRTKLKPKYPQVGYKYYDITTPTNMNLMKKYFKAYNIPSHGLSTPTTFIGKNYMLGYSNDLMSGNRLKNLIERNYIDEQEKQTEKSKVIQNNKVVDYIDTWFGRIDLKDKSLGVLAIVLGVADGFNPCAMWVLVYLLSLVVTLNDKRKIWLLVGTFLLASGVIYFFLMTALLNVFIYIGYIRLLELVFGCLALYIGLLNLKTYLIDKDHSVCKVANSKKKEKTKSRIKRIVESDITIFTILAMVGLAFIVNSMEFVCSAAIPAIYTSILAQAHLPAITYFFYICLYILFFLSNDLIIFATAAFAVDKFLDDKYVAPIQTVGAFILLTLGLLLIFSPELLR